MITMMYLYNKMSISGSMTLYFIICYESNIYSDIRKLQTWQKMKLNMKMALCSVTPYVGIYSNLNGSFYKSNETKNENKKTPLSKWLKKTQTIQLGLIIRNCHACWYNKDREIMFLNKNWPKLTCMKQLQNTYLRK